MTISYLSRKPFKSEEFLAAFIASSIPTDVALLLLLLSSTAIISFALLALHFNDPITTTMMRMKIATTLFIASTVALVECLGNQKQVRNYNENNNEGSGLTLDTRS